MPFIAREEPFVCEYCKKPVEPLFKGTYRDHCPYCLYGKHVDDVGPGDRASTCKGLLKPIGIDQDSKRGFMVLYKCSKCQKLSKNRAATDDRLIEFSAGL